MPARWHSAAVAAARAASAAILELRDATLQRQRKPDGSWVSAADHAASRAITQHLAPLDASVPVISEEGEHDPGGATRFWLVDPLDGTREFLRGSEAFSVNIALISDGYPCFGLICLPTSATLYQGAAGFGAWRDREPIRAATARQDAPCRVLVSPGQTGTLHAELAPRLATHGIDTRIVAEPGAVKFCRLAEGDADVYLRRTRTCGWDSAAGQAIVEAAGGAVYDAGWQRLGYAYQPHWYNGDFIAVADPVWRQRLAQG